MNYKDFISELSTKINITDQETNNFLAATWDIALKVLQEGCLIDVKPYGCFLIEKQDEYISVDPASGQKMIYPPSYKLRYLLKSTNVKSIADKKVNLTTLVIKLSKEKNLDRATVYLYIKKAIFLAHQVLKKDNYLSLEGWGVFKMINSLDGIQSISFEPDLSISAEINTPFSSFSPVPLNDKCEKLFSDSPKKKQQLNIVTVPCSTSSKEECDKEEAPEKKGNVENETPQPLRKDLKEEVEPSTNQEDKKEPLNISKEKDNSYLFYLIVSIISIALIVLLVTYNLDDNHQISVPQEEIQVIDTLSNSHEKEEDTRIELTNDSVISKDSLKKDTTVFISKREVSKRVNSDSAKKETKIAPKDKKPAPIIPDSTSYRIIGKKGTHAIKYGETLVGISLRYLGSKTLWPYLVKCNKIKNPNNVDVGTVLIIPKLEKK